MQMRLTKLLHKGRSHHFCAKIKLINVQFDWFLHTIKRENIDNHILHTMNSVTHPAKKSTYKLLQTTYIYLYKIH